ncbi:MAG TPA: hypothetical protein VJ946_14445 [Bacteroidales bacterium]|nr:hypothetical protein [Bacteroidales bacterium]
MARFLLILLLIFLFFRLMFRIVIPWLFRRKVNKMKNEQEKRSQEYRNRGKKEGDVTIENISDDKKSKRKKEKDKAEYTDYEEIDED